MGSRLRFPYTHKRSIPSDPLSGRNCSFHKPFLSQSKKQDPAPFIKAQILLFVMYQNSTGVM